MKKKKYSKFFSKSGSGHYYSFLIKKSPKLVIKKFDPIYRKRFLYFLK
ncbi:hypothetical protein [Candidatus Vidania fulgoroideorum]